MNFDDEHQRLPAANSSLAGTITAPKRDASREWEELSPSWTATRRDGAHEEGKCEIGSHGQSGTTSVA